MRVVFRKCLAIWFHNSMRFHFLNTFCPHDVREFTSLCTCGRNRCSYQYKLDSNSSLSYGISPKHIKAISLAISFMQ